jgi:hypothetical protein
VGLYDDISFDDPRAVCSEGHSLVERGFQTYDLGRTLGRARLAGGWLTFSPGGRGEPVTLPFTGELLLCTDCEMCPAWFSPGNGNIHACVVELWVGLEADALVSVERKSDASAVQLALETRSYHLANAIGPMPYAEALARHRAHRR